MILRALLKVFSILILGLSIVVAGTMIENPITKERYLYLGGINEYGENLGLYLDQKTKEIAPLDEELKENGIYHKISAAEFFQNIMENNLEIFGENGEPFWHISLKDFNQLRLSVPEEEDYKVMVFTPYFEKESEEPFLMVFTTEDPMIWGVIRAPDNSYGCSISLLPGEYEVFVHYLGRIFTGCAFIETSIPFREEEIG